MTALEQYFELEFAERPMEWLPLEIIPPWKSESDTLPGLIPPPRCGVFPGRHGPYLHVEAQVVGGESGSIAARLPPSLRPDVDQPKRYQSFRDCGRLMVESTQVCAGGYVRVWSPVELSDDD